MADTRELTMDDYLAMARRRLKVVIVPLLIAPIAGVLVSYAFPPKYTSTSQVLVEGQKVPDDYVAARSSRPISRSAWKRSRTRF